MVTCDASYRWSNAFTTSVGTTSSQPGASSEGTRARCDGFSGTRNDCVSNVAFVMTERNGRRSADGVRRAEQARRSVAERRHAVAACGLRPVHGGVGAVHQVLDVVAWLDLGDSDTGGHPAGCAHLGDGGAEPLGKQVAREADRDVGQDGEP